MICISVLDLPIPTSKAYITKIKLAWLRLETGTTNQSLLFHGRNGRFALQIAKILTTDSFPSYNHSKISQWVLRQTQAHVYCQYWIALDFDWVSKFLAILSNYFTWIYRFVIFLFQIVPVFSEAEHLWRWYLEFSMHPSWLFPLLSYLIIVRIPFIHGATTTAVNSIYLWLSYNFL